MLPARTPPPGVFLSIVFWFCARETHHQVAWIATLLFSAVVVASVVLPIVYQKNIKLVAAEPYATANKLATFATLTIAIMSLTSSTLDAVTDKHYMILFPLLRAPFVGLALAGIFAAAWTMASQTGLHRPRGFYLAPDGHVLITSGPFSWVRYPHVSAPILVELSIGVLLGNVIIILIASASFAVAHFYRVDKEDAIYGTLFKNKAIAYKKKRHIGNLVPIIKIE